MDDEVKDDFQTHSVTALPSKKTPTDFEIHSIVGVSDELRSDFELHGVRQDDDFTVHTQATANQPQEDFALNEVFQLQPSQREMPSLQNATVIGEFDPNGLPVFMDATTFQAMLSHLASLMDSTTPYAEIAGVPLGRYCRDRLGREFIEILGYLPFNTAPRGGDVQIPAEEWVRVGIIVDELKSKGIDVNELGWVHSHPNLRRPAPSDTDIQTHRDHFSLPFQTALIYDPYKKSIGAFGLDASSNLVNKKGIVITGVNRQSAQGITYCPDSHY